jgi:hypothetical protein
MALSRTDVSKEVIVSIIRLERMSEIRAKLAETTK